MKFNQNTLRIIAEGNHTPDQGYIIQMAKALMQQIFIEPRLDGNKRPDGSPQWYDVYKEGMKRAEIHHAATVNSYSIEIDGNVHDWISCKTLKDCKTELEKHLK